jgi:hypothetical protein
MRFFRARAGQGATEYLVLLAVVLIVALVSVALLGFFPGMTSDAQITQSQMYWRGAGPVAITESAAVYYNGNVYPYLRIKNNGAYPIRIASIVGADGLRATIFRSPGSSCGAPDGSNLSDYYYMAPGEEKYFDANMFGMPCVWFVYAVTTGSTSYNVGGASSLCQNSSSSPGYLDYKTIGFEYIEYIEGQQITKRQIGKDLIIKCREPV